MLWLLSMPSFELKPYNRGIVCIALLRALEVIRRRLWLGVAGGGGRWESLGRGWRVYGLGWTEGTAKSEEAEKH